jgi:hypothetical protein
VSEFYRPASEAGNTPYSLLVRLSADDKALLRRLTFARRQPASVVVRELLRAAAASLEVLEGLER